MPDTTERKLSPSAKETVLKPEKNTRVRTTLRYIAGQNGWSLAKLGEALGGLSAARIGGVMNGKFGATPAIVEALCGYLKLTEDQLFRQTGAFLFELPSWERAADLARTSPDAKGPDAPSDWVYEYVGNLPASHYPGDPADVDGLARWLASEAANWLRASTPESRSRAFSEWDRVRRALRASEIATSDGQDDPDRAPTVHSGEIEAPTAPRGRGRLPMYAKKV